MLISTNYIKLIKLNLPIIRTCTSQSATINHLVDKITLSDNKKMFVAWHPTVEFRYENTLPLPQYEEKQDSNVVENGAMAASKLFIKKHPDLVREQLAKITHTAKHRWYPRARDKRAKKTPMDREYL